jgi:hypothetical protein
VTLSAVRVAAMAGALAVAAACGGSQPSIPSVRLTTPNTGAAFVEVTGLSRQALAALAGTERTPEAWAAILRVSVSTDAPPVLGTYSLGTGTLRFTPAFPFDPGRQYYVEFDEKRVTSSSDVGAASRRPIIRTTVGLPASTATPTTTVAQIYPSGDTVPENLLRMYVEFSAPMGLSSGIDHLQLLDPDGVLVEGAFLPLDYEFWNAERTRFTVFFDPGRVKRGILPNRQSGRAMMRGRHYTLVVESTWRDGNGQPLKEEFRKTFLAGPADMQPLNTATWRIEPPAVSPNVGAAFRRPDPLIVTFLKPLDHGLLMRSLGVRRDGLPVDGQARVEAGETRWIFTPREPWAPGRYELLALSILEDSAGNQIGRAFEVDNFETVDKSPDPKTITVPFVVGG